MKFLSKRSTIVVAWSCIPFLIGLLAFVVARTSSGTALAAPRIEFPGEVNLGVREFGEVAIGRFTIANRGNAELIINDIRTNCACTGIERESDGRFFHIDDLRIMPGEQQNVVVRVGVRSTRVGAPMKNVVAFRTNDPLQLHGEIKVIVSNVTGGVFTSPKSLIFGTVHLGANVRHLVDVCDTALEQRTLHRIISVGSDRIKARLLPAKEASKTNGADGKRTVIARIEVEVDTSMPGEIHGEVQMQVSGPAREFDSFKIAGRVVAPIEIRPSSLILPRRSAAGRVFEAKVIISNSMDAPLSLTLETPPKGLRVQILPAESDNHRLIHVTWDPQELPVNTEGKRTVLQLNAAAGGVETKLSLPVLLQPTGEQ